MTPEGYNDLNELLERHLRNADQPLTCRDLFDDPEIRAVAPSMNRVSDYLGVMFRKGHVSRVPAQDTGTSRVRWAYVWREKVTPEWKKATQLKPTDFRPKSLIDRPNLHISEDGSHLTIEMPEISISIEIRKK